MSKAPNIRLTNELRREIRNNIIEAVTKEAVIATKIKENVVALKVLKFYLTDKNAALIAQLPAEYFNSKSSIEVRTPDGQHGTRVKLNLTEGFRAPAVLDYGYIELPPTHGLWKEIRVVVAEKDENSENAKSVQIKAEALLAGVTTVKTLLDTWPEAAPYLPEFAAKTNLPAVRGEELNTLIAAIKK